MTRRSRWFPFLSAASLFVLLVAVDVCLLVTCAPRARASARCTHCVPKGADAANLPSGGMQADAPCCVSGTIADAPNLAQPAVEIAPEYSATLALSLPALGHVRAERPRDEAPPPTAGADAPRETRGPPTR